MIEPSRIEAEILSQTNSRGSDSSICPSEVARNLSEEWRPLMSAVRAGAARLARQGLIEILRKGKPIEPDAMHGVIRLRAKEAAKEIV